MKHKKMKILWIAIILCFLLMGGPLVILLDHSNILIGQIPILYLFVFFLWIVLCVLTFLGWRMRWGEQEEAKDEEGKENTEEKKKT